MSHTRAENGVRRGGRASVIWWIAPVVYGLVAAVHVALVFVDNPLREPTKVLLMPALVLGVIAVSVTRPRAPRGVLLLLLFGVLASWFGDEAGLFVPGLPTLPLMLAFFGIAHLAYMWLFLRGRGVAVLRRPPLWSLVYALWWVVLLIIIGPHTGALFWGIAAYGLVLGGTAVLASRCGPVIAWGGFWFLMSDSLLAFFLFIPTTPQWIDGLVMLTYTLGQGLIGFGVMARFRAGATPGVRPGAQVLTAAPGRQENLAEA